jgi:hypothetical protein
MSMKCPRILIDCCEPEYVKRLDGDRFTANHIYVADVDYLTYEGSVLGEKKETLRMSKPSSIGIALTPIELTPFTRDGVFHFAYNVTYKVTFSPPKGVSENTIMIKNGSYTTGKDYDMGIIWLTNHEICTMTWGDNERNMRSYFDLIGR